MKRESGSGGRWCAKVPLCALLLLVAQGATAQTSESEEPPLWEFRIAAFGRYAPIYPGSPNQNLTVLPLPYPVYRGSRLRFGENFDTFAEGRVIERPRVKLDINFNVNFGEDSEDIDGREGMPNLDPLLEVGPELEIRLTDRAPGDHEWLLALQLRAAVSFDGGSADGRGYLLNPELEYRVDQAFGTRNDLSFRWKSTWASEDYTDYYYGVAPEFETLTRSSFDASSGYIGSEFRIGFERQLTEKLRFDGNVKLWVNKGAENRDSPLFHDDYGFGLQAAFIWTLGESETRGK
ncbi:MAG: MipA/OmpV family protein [Candidatus Rariloculaceae bacterium]